MRSTLKIAVKTALLVLVIRPFVWFFLGLNRYARLQVAREGPCILAPTHNSHLDTVLVLGLLPLRVALRARVVAAADYFGSVPGLSWLLFKVFDMVPVWRRAAGDGAASASPLEPMGDVLDQGGVLVLYPEGTRGLPEQRVTLKHGVAHLALRFPEVPVYPICVRGLGKTLPRGELVFVPLIPQVALGEPIFGRSHDKVSFINSLEAQFAALDATLTKTDWVTS